MAPPANRRSDPRSLLIADYVVAKLLHNDGVDFLALGEVNGELLLRFKKLFGIPDLELLNGAESDSTLNHDIGILYRKSRLSLLNKQVIESGYARSKLKIAIRFDMAIAASSLPIHFFAVHWPSRIWRHENSAEREVLGSHLYNITRTIADSSPKPPQIVILGDFNDDPGDVSLAGRLLATRDRGLARKYPQYFYNPFWRHLGESHPHIPGTKCNSIAGTCLYRKGTTTRWNTFDQIIVSSALVKDSEWELREDHTKIWRCDLLDGEIRSPSSIFDHFPVVASLESKHKRS